MRGEPGQLPRHPLGGALRTSEEPPRPASFADVEELSPGPFTFLIENMGLRISADGNMRELKKRLGSRYSPDTSRSTPHGSPRIASAAGRC